MDEPFFTEWSRALQQALLEPFPLESEEYLPRGGGKDGQAKAAQGMVYAGAEAVIARLNDTVGPHGWTFTSELIPSERSLVVYGRLTVLGATQEDFGEAGKEGEPFKAARTDALKRCARNFGIGLYLWFFPKETWGQHDGHKWTKLPDVPPAARLHAARLAGWQGELRQPARPQPASRPESRGDANAQRVTAAAETSQGMPITGGMSDAQLQALKAGCRALHTKLTGSDDNTRRSADYRARLGLQERDAISPAEWVKLRDLLTAAAADPFADVPAASDPARWAQ